MNEAERIVARLDSYSQDEHAGRIDAARAAREIRAARAAAAAAALREAADDGEQFLGRETDSGIAWDYILRRADRIERDAAE